jgi:predicted nucleic acid-binding protein
MPTDAERFDELMAAVLAGAAHFGHRQHVHLSWLAVRRYGATEACRLVCAGIQRTARYAGAPQKYHSTVSRAWIELIAYHVGQHDTADFERFAALNPALLDKRLLLRFYEPATLSSAAARSGWVEPDRARFPR